MACEHFANGRQQVRYEAVLDDEPDNAKANGLIHVLALMMHRHEHDLGGNPTISELPCGGNAAHTRHCDIEYKYIRHVSRCGNENGGAIEQGGDDFVLCRQQVHQAGQHRAMVVRDQDAGPFHGSVVRTNPHDRTRTIQGRVIVVPHREPQLSDPSLHNVALEQAGAKLGILPVVSGKIASQRTIEGETNDRPDRTA